jgi:ATP-dependent Clp protease adaptor protein ClpS
MFEAPRVCKRPFKNKHSQAVLRAHKHALDTHGIIDWHLYFHEKDFEINKIKSMASVDDDVHHDEEVDVMTAPPQLKKPPFYAVVLFNDDYTPMEFVIEILQQYFALDLDRATEVMLTVHYRGKGVAGVYPRDIAETKAQQVNTLARSRGHPLLWQIEPQSE